MKVLVIGAAGTVGLALSKELAGRGHQLRCVDVAPPRYDVGEALKLLGYDPLPPAAEWIYQDASSFAAALALVQGMDAVAYVALAPALDDDSAQWAVNLAMPLYLLSGCARCRVPKFVYASSVSVNGPRKNQVVTEQTPPALWGSYGVSKWLAEALMSQFAQQYGLSVISLRLGTICPHLRRGANVGGPHTQVRVDVRDAARAFRLALEDQSIRNDVFQIVSQGEPVYCDPAHAKEGLGFAAEFNGAEHFEELLRRQTAFQAGQRARETRAD